MAAPLSALARPPQGEATGRPRAVVIGGGIAGLAACSALAPHVSALTLIEQEVLPDTADLRRHTPQAPHVHALLDSGRQALEQLLPGLAAELQQAGSLPLKVRSQWRSHDGHEWCAPEDTGPVVLSQSRQLLEHVLRRRVRALPGLTVVAARMRGLHLATAEAETKTDGTPARISGVQVQEKSGPARTIAAEIVVDASGRAGDSLKWLAAAGLPCPPEETRSPDIRYCSAFFRRSTAAGPSEHVSAWLRPAQAPETRSLVIAPVEAARWVVTLTGRFGAPMPRDEAGFRQLLQETAGAELSARFDAAPMLSPLRGFAINAVRLRRFDQMPGALPPGYFPIGDAIATFNPLYGQGMSVAALQALALHETLATHADPAAAQRTYLAAAHRPAAWAWAIGGAVDRAYPQMRQQADAASDHLAARLRLAFSASVMRPGLRGQIDRVLHLLDPPDRLDAICAEPV